MSVLWSQDCVTDFNAPYPAFYQLVMVTSQLLQEGSVPLDLSHSIIIVHMRTAGLSVTSLEVSQPAMQQLMTVTPHMPLCHVLE